MEGDVYLQPHDKIRNLLLQNFYTVCFELQTHERINRNNKKLKELDENEWNATACFIQLKTERICRCPGIGIQSAPGLSATQYLHRMQ
jgi:hypothetical protein